MAVEQHLVFISWRNSGPSRPMRVNASSFFVLAPWELRFSLRTEGERKLSWGPQVITDSGQWAGNGLRFATQEEAATYVAELEVEQECSVVDLALPEGCPLWFCNARSPETQINKAKNWCVI